MRKGDSNLALWNSIRDGYKYAIYKIAYHYNAFTPFSVIIQHVSKGKHKLKVSVDNTFGEHSALHVPNDYYTYGGITRPVAMEYLPDANIKSIQFLPYKKENQWHARMEIAVANLSEKSANLSLSCHIADTTIHSLFRMS